MAATHPDQRVSQFIVNLHYIAALIAQFLFAAVKLAIIFHPQPEVSKQQVSSYCLGQ